MISPNSIEQILNVAAIEDVVGDYVNLKRAGSRYKGLCPFHDEKTPSFTVTPSLGIYKCFGCQKGGNSIQFLMDVENLSFAEAAKSLAGRYGIELIETGQKDDEEYREKQLYRESIQAALDYAALFFESQLHDTEFGRAIGLSYFKERGFTADTIKKWRLGFSPDDWEAFVKKAQSDGYKLEYLEAAGLVKKRDNGTYYDLYRNRVIFPLYSVSGKIIGFAGRKMSNTDPAPKYVNSPETDLYKKSDNLFGIFQAKSSIKKHDKVYLTEGYTDVITLHQSGIENVVASSGTALTVNQIKLLRRFTDNVTVVYDGDAAGIKASLRGIDLLLTEGLNVRVVGLPEGEDPDSYCSKLGGDAFMALLEEKQKNFILFKADLLLSEAADDPLRKADAVRGILESVACITDNLKRSAMLTELARVCSMEESMLASELGKLLRGKFFKHEQDAISENNSGVIITPPVLPREEFNDNNQERTLMRVFMKFGGLPFDDTGTVAEIIIKEIQEDDALIFNDPACAALVAEIRTGELKEAMPLSYFLQHTDLQISSWAAGELSSEHDLSAAFEDNFIYVRKEADNFKQELSSVLLHLRRKKLDTMIQNAMESLKSPETDAEFTLEFINFLNERKRNLAKDIGMAVDKI
jgi:DNA primase